MIHYNKRCFIQELVAYGNIPMKHLKTQMAYDIIKTLSEGELDKLLSIRVTDPTDPKIKEEMGNYNTEPERTAQIESLYLGHQFLIEMHLNTPE